MDTAHSPLILSIEIEGNEALWYPTKYPCVCEFLRKIFWKTTKIFIFKTDVAKFYASAAKNVSWFWSKRVSIFFNSMFKQNFFSGVVVSLFDFLSHISPVRNGNEYAWFFRDTWFSPIFHTITCQRCTSVRSHFL